jgi:hypothetical protein
MSPRASEPRRIATTRPAVSLFRAAAATVKAHALKVTPTIAAAKMFDRDAVVDLILRAAADPATMSNSTWAGTLAIQAISDTVAAITSQSAAAGLIARGTKLTFDGAASIKVPGRLLDASDAGSWVAEGGSIVLRNQRMTAGVTLAPRKLAVICSFSNEMVNSSNIENISRALLAEAAALALDAAVFSATADDGVTPGGILAGVTPVTAGTTMAGDVGKLIGALAAAGAGRDPVLIAHPSQATSLSMSAGTPPPVLQSSSLAAGTVIAVESSSFVSAFGAVPEFSVSPYAMLTFDDAAPPDFPGGNVKSTFQVDSVALKMLLHASFGMRAPHVAYLTGATW